MPESVTWYLASMSRCTLNMSSGYRRCDISAGEMSERGLTVSGNAFIHVFRIGSLSSQAYSSTEPSYALTTALTELRM